MCVTRVNRTKSTDITKITIKLRLMIRNSVSMKWLLREYGWVTDIVLTVNCQANIYMTLNIVRENEI